MPPFAEMDATGLALLVTAACAGVGGVVTGVVTLVVQYLDRKAARRDKEEERAAQDARELRKEAREDARAREVADVKTALKRTTAETAETLEGIAKVGDLTHDLVNSASLVASIRPRW